jgi:hypothetical protein
VEPRPLFLMSKKASLTQDLTSRLGLGESISSEIHRQKEMDSAPQAPPDHMLSLRCCRPPPR